MLHLNIFTVMTSWVGTKRNNGKNEMFHYVRPLITMVSTREVKKSSLQLCFSQPMITQGRRHLIHFFRCYFLSSRCLFMYDCGECVLYSLGQVCPWCNPSQECGVGPGTISASGLLLCGIVITWNQHPPPKPGFGIGSSACTDVRQGFLPRGWRLPVSPVYKLVKQDTSGCCGRVNYTQRSLFYKMRA